MTENGVKDMFDLRGKKALVTGATQGIGFAIAKTLADRGARVYVNGASGEEKCAKAAAQIPGSVGVCVDLSKEGCGKKLYEKTGDVDILVLNASVQYRRCWEEIPSEEFDKQIRVNLKSSLELIQIYAAHMKEQNWGRIVTIGSVQQYRPHKDMAVYAATKAAGENLSRNLAKQLAPYGITVNNVAPGVIATPRNEEALSDPEYSKKVMEGIPCGYAGSAEDCAGGVLLLCSEEGRYITGTDLVIDGGMHL